MSPFLSPTSRSQHLKTLSPHCTTSRSTDWLCQLSLTLSLFSSQVCLAFAVAGNLRPTVSRQSFLVSGSQLGPLTNFSFLLKFALDNYRCVTLCRPLWRENGSLLYNCFWALPEQSHLGRNPAELTALFYCLIWNAPNLANQVPLIISPRNRVAQLYPRAFGSLSVASYESQGIGGGILTRIHTFLCSTLYLSRWVGHNRICCSRSGIITL
jgi:hypothetical protein